jgi:hypothetical protein
MAAGVAGMALVLGGAVCWSLGGVLVRLTDGIDIWQIVFYRSIVMLVVISAWIWSMHGNQSFAIVRRPGGPRRSPASRRALPGSPSSPPCSIPPWRRPSS